ncbi:MAG TPA: CoA-binding protein [Armatimonadota bacterium]|nr:CoA-binding protein [Armatimonadota bacterium]HQK93461.1 CoA-binding protein [Armatimonadota bacterium]
MRQTIESVLAGKSVAVAGVSRRPRGFGRQLYIALRQRGYTTYAINPHAESIGGDPCYASPRMLPRPVDWLLAVTPRSATAQVVREAAQAGITRVWMQPGSECPEAIQAAREAGMVTVTRACLFLHLEPVTWPHSWHRALAKVFGRLYR